MGHRELWQVESIVEQVARSPVERVYIGALARLAGVNLEQTVEAIDCLQQESKVRLAWEVLCEECGRPSRLTVGLPEELDATITCVQCFTQIIVDEDSTIPSIEVMPDYADFVKKNSPD